MQSNKIVKLEDVSFSYNSRLVVQDVNLSIKRNDFVWVVGPNGGGKTTLIKLILGLLTPSKGAITVFGGSPKQMRTKIGYMPQHTELDLHFPVTVFEVALMGRLDGNSRLGFYSHKDRQLTKEALERVGLADCAHNQLSELSGGQQRRLLIARAMAANAELLILDEPTANLDRQVEREFYHLLRKLNKTMTVILVSHDPAFVSDFVKEVVCINQTCSIHPTSAMEGELVDELYGRQMRIVHHDRHHHDQGSH